MAATRSLDTGFISSGEEGAEMMLCFATTACRFLEQPTSTSFMAQSLTALSVMLTNSSGSFPVRLTLRRWIMAMWMAVAPLRIMVRRWTMASVEDVESKHGEAMASGTDSLSKTSDMMIELDRPDMEERVDASEAGGLSTLGGMRELSDGGQGGAPCRASRWASGLKAPPAKGWLEFIKWLPSWPQTGAPRAGALWRKGGGGGGAK